MVTNEDLGRIRIGGSLGRMLMPTIELIVNQDGSHELSLRITVPNACGEGYFEGLESRHPLTPYIAERCGRDLYFLAKQVRIAMLKALEHELDESLYVGSQLLNPPKHWGPDDTNT